MIFTLEDFRRNAVGLVYVVQNLVQAFANGSVDLPSVNRKTKYNVRRNAPSFIRGVRGNKEYTMLSIAQHLGIAKAGPRGTIQAEEPVIAAVQALECKERGLITDAQIAECNVQQLLRLTNRALKTIQ
jgi:hypothetical protein